jgi:ribonuclease PH
LHEHRLWRLILTRADGRLPHQLRPVRITPDPLSFAEGSALIEFGRTRVLCAVTVEDRVPQFLRGTGRGWVTAEYSMLPRSTQTRTQRESVAGRIGGRTHEIQRLIGRSLRAVTDLTTFGERSLTVDCDVIQADGGTRTASITGAFVALSLAFSRLRQDGKPVKAIRQAVAAVSAGVVDGEAVLDLDYPEDSHAEVDFNVVMTEDGRFVEVQGTAEGSPFDRDALDRILALTSGGIRELFALQREVIAQATRPVEE